MICFTVRTAAIQKKKHLQFVSLWPLRSTHILFMCGHFLFYILRSVYESCFFFFFVPVLGVGIYARGHEGGDLSGRPK